MTFGAKKRKKLNTNGNVWIYALFLAFPVVQFLIFTVYVSFNSFAMAFKEYEIVDSSFTIVDKFSFANFKSQLKWLGTADALSYLKVSAIGYLLSLLVGVPLGLLFAYYIYKNRGGAGFFRVLLFLPSIIPAIVLVTIYVKFVSHGLPAFLQETFNLSKKPDSLWTSPKTSTRMGVVYFYNVLVSFGVSVLMNANKMSSIDPSISEAASIDGASEWKEFIHITLPMTYPTISVFLVTGIANFFMNQLNLFSFTGWQPEANMQSLGFYFFYQASDATSHGYDYKFAELSALGLIMTFVAIPVTFGVRYLLNKLGPSEE